MWEKYQGMHDTSLCSSKDLIIFTTTGYEWNELFQTALQPSVSILSVKYQTGLNNANKAAKI